MGMYRSIYLGAYAVAKYKAITKQDVELRCPSCNKQYNLRQPQNFCSDCGTKIEEVNVSYDSAQTYYDIVYENETDNVSLDQLVGVFINIEQDDFDILIPNLRGIGIRLEDLDGEMLLTETDAIESLKKFEDQYSDIIKLLKPHYESIEIRYGVVSWYS